VNNEVAVAVAVAIPYAMARRSIAIQKQLIIG